MSDDGNWIPTAWLTAPPFTFPLSTPQETPTDFPVSTPSEPRTSLEISLPTLTKTEDPTRTGVLLSTFGTLATISPTYGSPTSFPLSVWSPITIHSSPLSSPRPTHTTHTRHTYSPRTSSTSSGSSLITSVSSFKTSSLSSTSSHSPSTTSSTTFSRTSTSFPPPVTQTTLPSFGSSSDNSPQTRTSSGHTGMIVAAATGAIALVIIAALMAILCRKRYLKRVRQRAASNPFLDLDGEMVAVNEPLIIGGEPGSGAVAYSDPFTDDSRQVNQSGSLTTGLGSVTRRSSNESHEAVVNHSPTPTPDPRGGFTAGQLDQPRPTNQLSPPSLPPLQRPGIGIAPSRSPQSLPQVQTQFQPQIPVPGPSSPPFDSGAIAYLRYADQIQDRSLPSPEHRSPGNPEGHRLTSAFSVASEPSPRYSAYVPPLNMDEAWGSIPDPIRALSSYRPSIDRRRSFTPSVSGPAYEPGDTMVVAPYNNHPRGPTRGPISPGSEDIWNPYDIRDRDFSSRPSTIPEVSETATHSQEASNDSGGTSMSSHVVLTAERVQFTPMALSTLSLALPSHTTSPALSSGSFYEDPDPPPVPPLPPVQPLSLGKNRSHQS